MVPEPDPGCVRQVLPARAWFWCDDCKVTTLHLSPGPLGNRDGGSALWPFVCQACGVCELRAVGPWPYDNGPPEGWEVGDAPPLSDEPLWVIEYAKLESARDWLIGALMDRVLPAAYLVRMAWAFRIHERTLYQVKVALGIESRTKDGRSWWVAPWVNVPAGWLARGKGGTRGVQGRLRSDLSGDPNEEEETC